MLSREEDIDIHALRKRGWSISAIARHTGRDRKTIRAYLNGQRQVGVRKTSRPDSFEPFVAYCQARLTEDPHVWVTTLLDELLDLGFTGGYSTLTRQIRKRGLRPVCQECLTVKDRPVAVIDHPPGEETQWDWVELPDPPASWGWTGPAHLLVGVLAHSGKWRGVLAESEQQPFLVDGLDRISRALGGLTHQWRFDRMTTVCDPGSGRVSASFAAVAKHYGVSVKICPPRRGNRKGVVEKAVHVAAQRWWRTLPDDVTVDQAQVSLDKWCQLRGDTRIRRTKNGRYTVATLVAAEPLSPVPAVPFPAELSAARTVSGQSLVAWAGNFYSVPAALARAEVTCRVRLGADLLTISPADQPATVVAAHRLAPAGAGVMIRSTDHVAALNTVAMTAAASPKPHGKKTRIPPGPAARAAAAALTGRSEPDVTAVVIDLSTYQHAATGRNTLK